jgi:hypothetical protein
MILEAWEHQVRSLLIHSATLEGLDEVKKCCFRIVA